MGDMIEVQWLAGKPYIVTQNERTGWQPCVTPITTAQYQAVSDLHDAHADQINQLLLTILSQSGGSK